MKWRTKDGREIELAEMSDEHLFNTYVFLRRRLVLIDEELEASYAYAPCGEMASYYAEGERSSVSAKLAGVGRWLLVIKKELARRGQHEDDLA